VNALLKDGSKSDRIDARKLAELLRGNQLSPVYHGEHGVRTLKELARSYLTISQDLVRVMVRVKALYRSWAIPCSGQQVYAVRHRAFWLEKIGEAGVRRRAEFYYQHLDALRSLRQEVRRITRSGFRIAAFSTAARPSSASPQTSQSFPSSRFRSARLEAAESSAMSMRVILAS
jgi:hypothetical protein